MVSVVGLKQQIAVLICFISIKRSANWMIITTDAWRKVDDNGITYGKRGNNLCNYHRHHHHHCLVLQLALLVGHSTNCLLIAPLNYVVCRSQSTKPGSVLEFMLSIHDSLQAVRPFAIKQNKIKLMHKNCARILLYFILLQMDEPLYFSSSSSSW